MIYFVLLFKPFSPTFLVVMYANFRPPSHQSILCIFHLLPFLTKCILLEIYPVCLLSLPFLSIHTAYLISSIIRWDSYGTIFGYLFKNSFINILKFVKVIPAVHFVLYSLYALEFAHLDKRSYMLLYFCQFLDNLAI